MEFRIGTCRNGGFKWAYELFCLMGRAGERKTEFVYKKHELFFVCFEGEILILCGRKFKKILGFLPAPCHIYWLLNFFVLRKLDEGIERFRTILKAVEVRTSQTMRTTVARELAEVLLRGVCMHHYTPPPAEGIMSSKDERSGSLKSTSSSFSNLRPIASKGNLKPKLYSTER